MNVRNACQNAADALPITAEQSLLGLRWAGEEQVPLTLAYTVWPRY